MIQDVYVTPKDFYDGVGKLAPVIVTCTITGIDSEDGGVIRSLTCTADKPYAEVKALLDAGRTVMGRISDPEYYVASFFASTPDFPLRYDDGMGVICGSVADAEYGIFTGFFELWYFEDGSGMIMIGIPEKQAVIFSGTLKAADWDASTRQQTVQVGAAGNIYGGYTDGDSPVFRIKPASESRTEYRGCRVKAVSVSAGTDGWLNFTFSAERVPSADLKFNLLVQAAESF